MLDANPLSTPPAEHRYEARLTPEQQRTRDQHVATVREYQAKSIEAACALAAIKDEGLYVEDGNFQTFAKRHFGFSKSRAYELAQAGLIYAELEEAGVSPLPRSAAHVHPLTKLKSPVDRQEAWDRAIAGRDPDEVTMEHVLAVVREMLGEDAPEAVSELRGLSSDELVAGRMLRRVKATYTDARDFRRYVENEVGRSETWAETAMAYAELCDAVSEGARPALGAFERYHDKLAPLAVEDQAAVWERLAARSGAARPAYKPSEVKRALREVVAAGFEELGLPLDDAEQAGPSHDTDRPLSALLDASLLDEPLREQVVEAGDEVAPSSYLLSYEDVPDGAIEAIVDAMRDERDMPGDPSKERKRLVFGQRQMVRVGFEPDVATWAWPVLTPATKRFPRAWLPEPGQGAPCFVPRRLLQPSMTERRSLSAEDRRKRVEERVYVVDDDERFQSRVVLLAPGVDLTHEALSGECVGLVLEHAAEATEFVLLAVALDPERLSRHTWPTNVLPVVPASTPEEAQEAVGAFCKASCRGVLLVQDATEPIGNLDVDAVQAHLAAVLVRGEDTERPALQSLLGLRRYNVRVQVGRDLTVREVEPVFDPAAFVPSAGGDGAAADAEAVRVTAGTKRARLPGRDEQPPGSSSDS